MKQTKINKISKKSQLTVFVIAGLLVVLVLFFVIFKFRTMTNTSGKTGETTSFSGDVEQLKAVRDACVEDAVKKVVIFRNTAPTEENKLAIEDYIKWKIYRCFDTTIFTTLGYSTTLYSPLASEVLVNAEINDETIIITGSYPIQIEKDGQLAALNEFSYVLPKSSTLDLSVVENKVSYLGSTDDNNFRLIIPKSTSFTSYEGTKLDELAIKIFEKSQISASPYIFGNNVYEVTDSIVDENVKVCMNYDEGFFTSDISEKDLGLAWYDEKRGVWVIRPSEVNTEAKTICAEFEHFTGNGAVMEDYVLDYTKDFFIEHIHRPCSPAPLFSRKTDPRYVGLYNMLPEEESFETEEETRWKFNDFEDAPLEDAPHRYSVYALPQMYNSLLVRGTDGDEQEYFFKGNPEIKVSKDELYGAGGEWLFSGTDTINVKETETNIDRITGEEIVLDKTIYGTETDWKKVISFEPNEKAESEANIQDWDDDDLHKLEEKLCNGKPCVTCNGIACDAYQNDVTEQCYTKCYQDVKKKYQEDFELKLGWAPWEIEQGTNDRVSGDGFVDEEINTGQPNIIDCKVNTQYIDPYPFLPDTLCDDTPENCQAAVESCDFNPKEDIATPMFWGYGGEKRGLSEGQGNYRDSEEYGYEGVGNNDFPVTDEFEVAGPLCDGVEADMTIDCSSSDYCKAVLNGKTFECTSGTCEYKIVNLLVGPESSQKTNKITGYVLNKKDSQDVCAHMSVNIMSRQCKPKVNGPYCGDDTRQGNEVCDGTDDEACPGKCIMSPADKKCTCPIPQEGCPTTSKDKCKNDGNCVSIYGQGSTCNVETCDCITPIQESCIVCHFSQAEDNSCRTQAAPPCNPGHYREGPIEKHCNDVEIRGSNFPMGEGDSEGNQRKAICDRDVAPFKTCFPCPDNNDNNNNDNNNNGNNGGGSDNSDKCGDGVCTGNESVDNCPQDPCVSDCKCNDGKKCPGGDYSKCK